MATPIIPRRRVQLGSLDHAHWHRFIDPPREPRFTPDRRTPAVSIRRHVGMTLDLPLPYRLADGSNKLRMWVIGEPGGAGARYPSPVVRVRAGQLFHCLTETSKAEHTIHWHGIEPTPMNDGVGKHSFEIRDRYTYQWQAAQPGFFFYHCHKNTTLHFEMGLFGALIVDPARGKGWVEAYNPAGGHVLRYDREVIWVCTAHDSRWHRLHQDHGMGHNLDPNQPAGFTRDGILNDWRPDVFTLSGAVAYGANPITDPRAAVSARVGEVVLLRVLNAAYCTTRIRIGDDVQVIAQDGRAHGVPPFGTYSTPRTITAGTAFELTTAQRYDLLLRPTSRGTFPVRIDYLDWRGYGLRGTARTTITVT